MEPGSVFALFQRGATRLEQGDPAGAALDFDSAIAANPRAVEAYAWRARARLALGDRSGALADCEVVLARAPTDWGGFAEIVRLAESLRSGTSR